MTTTNNKKDRGTPISGRGNYKKKLDGVLLIKKEKHIVEIL
jgi:hypothetical protein